MTKKETKSTAVVVVDEARLAALRAKAGTQDGGSEWPTKLRVNRRPFAEDGETVLPMGKYFLKLNEVEHYFTELDMIVMEKGTQFMRFTGSGKRMEYVGCTMIENTFNPEYKDTLGGTRLGRISGQTAEEMTAAQKEVKFYFHMLGVVDISHATNREGKRIYGTNEAKWVGVSLQFKGKAAVEKQDEFKVLKKKTEAYFEFITRLTKPVKAGDIEGVPYYDFTFERGDNVTITPELIDSIEAVQTLVENENKRILKLHLAAQNKNTVTEALSYTDIDLNDDEEVAE